MAAPRSSATVAARNKKVREEALREQLRQKGLHTQVLNIAEKLHDEYKKLNNAQINALRSSADIKMKLINKYMPDLKAVEHAQDPDNPITDMSDAELKGQIKALMEKLDDAE